MFFDRCEIHIQTVGGVMEPIFIISWPPPTSYTGQPNPQVLPESHDPPPLPIPDSQIPLMGIARRKVIVCALIHLGSNISVSNCDFDC